MKFDELDRRMRSFETSHDFCVPMGTEIVLRLDGRSFTRLTKEGDRFEAPFDTEFRDAMVETVRHLMSCGLNVTFGYTQSDEISLLLHPEESAFGRKTRKLNSILAGEASAKFSRTLGLHGVFDCRVCRLPDLSRVVDYFRWRSEDAYRNCLSAHCYWQLRKLGQTAREASAELEGMSTDAKIERLGSFGVAFGDLPRWQKHGTGFFWDTYEKEGFNPQTGEAVTAVRRGIRVDAELPDGPGFSEYLKALLETKHVSDTEKR